MAHPQCEGVIERSFGTICKDGTQDTKAKAVSINLHDDKASSLLQGLTLSSCQPDTTLGDLQETRDIVLTPQQVSPRVYTVSNKMMCSLCDSKFDNREQQKEHYKLDWHRFNLKQRMMGAESVTMETFEAMSGDISSISGSDSSISESDNDDHLSPYSDRAKIDRIQSKTVSDTENVDSDGRDKAKQRSHPRVFFKNSQGQLISVHRCILHGRKNVPSSHSDLISMATKLSTNPKWAIIMTGGGHFAAAIFNGSEMVAHKTFHRYTVRAKRGTAQGMRDAQQGGKQPRSAGASLRRYNEAALVQDIQDLLESWKNDLNSCQRIFVRAPSYNRGIFYSGKNPPFSKDDVRISSLPFPTRRATLKEIQRIHEVLSSVQCHGEAEAAEARLTDLFSTKMAAKLSQKSVLNKNTETLKERDTSITENLDQEPGVKEEKISDEEIDDDDGDVDIHLTYEEVEISTSHLKEFDCTKKPRRRKKKKKVSEQSGIAFGEDTLMNNLYTACKTGNTDKLELLLNEIRATFSTKSSPEEINHESSKAGSCITTDELVAISEAEKSDRIVSTEEQQLQVLTDENKTIKPHNEEKNTTKDHGSSCENIVTTPGLKTEMNRLEIKEERTSNTIGEIDCGEICQDLSAKDASTVNIDPVTSVLNNAIDNKGTTLLHVAAETGQRSVLWVLLQSGSDPSRRNKKGQPPYVVSASREIRSEFRRFMAAHPEKYDYKAAQIPSPLTVDMEEERASKAAEKKKAQRKAKRAKQKEQMEEEKKKNAEEKEKAWFAGLSDREKRALAAESRLAKQQTVVEQSRPRCWLCGDNMTGKVPFEYLDFKFCSMKCLKQHKEQQQQQQKHAPPKR